jgi:hypothetical protein
MSVVFLSDTFPSASQGLVSIQCNLERWMQNEIHYFRQEFHLHLKKVKGLIQNKNHQKLIILGLSWTSG